MMSVCLCSSAESRKRRARPRGLALGSVSGMDWGFGVRVVFLLVVVMIGWVLWGAYGEAGGGGEAGEERSAWGGEVRCAGER